MSNTSVVNPLSKKQTRKTNKNKNLLESSSSDEERQRAAGSSALTPRPLRVTSAAKRQCLDNTDNMEVEPTQSTVSSSSPSSNVSSSVSVSSAAASAHTVVDNDTPTTSLL